MTSTTNSQLYSCGTDHITTMPMVSTKLPKSRKDTLSALKARATAKRDRPDDRDPEHERQQRGGVRRPAEEQARDEEDGVLRGQVVAGHRRGGDREHLARHVHLAHQRPVPDHRTWCRR
jgi:hypothetical protein